MREGQGIDQSANMTETLKVRSRLRIGLGMSQPPEFFRPVWEPLSNVTSWFDWNAFAAIGTVGALWFAILQSSKSARLERIRVIGTLTTVISLIEPLNDAVPIFDYKDDEAFLSRDDLGWLIDAHPLIDRAIAGLKLISVAEAAAAGISDWMIALSGALEDLKTTLPKSKNARAKVFTINQNINSQYIQEATQFIKGQFDLLKYGRFGLWFRRHRRFAEMRRHQRILDEMVNGPDS